MAHGKVFAAILAGGSGTRMGATDRPKQFLMLGDAPILAHTIEKFVVFGSFDGIVVLSPQSLLQQTRDLIARHLPEHADGIAVAAGGETRNDTVRNALAYFTEHFEVGADDVIVTHDAVRPFVSHRIIEENIEAAREVGACDTVIPCTDTIVESADGEFISSIPNRRALFQGQTPQSFKLLALKELMESLSDEEKAVLTDACKIFALRQRPVALVEGDPANMKITYPQDMRIAAALLEA